MIKYKKMEQKDLELMIASNIFKELLQFQPTDKELFCFLGEDNGQIVTGLSGVHDGQKAEIKTVVLTANETHIIKEGLIRASIHMLDRMGIEFLETNIKDDVFSKIGFSKKNDEDYRISIAEFFAQPGC
jgi:hypothetical protein